MRRAPKSSTLRPSAASTTRRALLASTVCRWIWFMTSVSTSWASGSGAVTSRMGSSPNIGVPSATARTDPVNRKSRSQSRKSAVKMSRPSRYAMSAALKRRFSSCSSTLSSPQAIR